MKGNGFLIIILINLTNIILSITNYKLGGEDGNIRVFLLNLNRRHDRLKYCDQQLTQIGLNYTRIPAIDAHAIKKRLYDKIPPLDPMIKFDINAYMKNESNCQIGCGWIGCYLTHINAHLKIIEEARKGIDGPVLILEDDIHVLPNITTAVNEVINQLPSNWEQFTIGYKHLLCGGAKMYESWYPPPEVKFCRPRWYLDWHAYILRDSKAAVHYFERENNEIKEAIDTYFNLLMDKMEVNIYALRPPVVFQNKEFKSDIWVDPKENTES